MKDNAKNNYKSLKTNMEEYKNKVTSKEPKTDLFLDMLKAFLFGGLICLIGQFLTDVYSSILHISAAEAGSPASATLIFISTLLTGFGVFDKIAKHAGAGLSVPVTGFANSMSSAALEFRREGFVLGVGSKMFSLAGSVITFGVVTAFLVGILFSVFVS